MASEFIKLCDVRPELASSLDEIIQSTTNQNGVRPVAFYRDHNSPIWFAGEVQLTVVTENTTEWIDIYKGGHGVHLLVRVEKLGAETLKNIVNCLFIEHE